MYFSLDNTLYCTPCTSENPYNMVRCLLWNKLKLIRHAFCAKMDLKQTSASHWHCTTECCVSIKQCNHAFHSFHGLLKSPWTHLKAALCLYTVCLLLLSVCYKLNLLCPWLATVEFGWRTPDQPISPHKNWGHRHTWCTGKKLTGTLPVKAERHEHTWCPGNKITSKLPVQAERSPCVLLMVFAASAVTLMQQAQGL